MTRRVVYDEPKLHLVLGGCILASLFMLAIAVIFSLLGLSKMHFLVFFGCLIICLIIVLAVFDKDAEVCENKKGHIPSNRKSGEKHEEHTT